MDINPNYTDSMEIETFTMHLAFESTFSDDVQDSAGVGVGNISGAGGGSKGRQQLHALDLMKKHTLPLYNNPGLLGFEAGLDEVRN